MGMQEAVKLYFKNYFKFEGRSRRAEYWWPVLALFLFSIIIQIVSGIFVAMGDAGAIIAGLLMLVSVVVSLGTFIPSIAVAFRRLHDTDRSAWWLLIGFIPLIGAIVLIIFFALEGTKGSNKFGEDPKGFSSVETF